MIKLTIGTNTERKTVIVNPKDNAKNVLTQQGINIDRTAMHLNGSPIPAVDLNNTFEGLGIADESEAMIIAVVKADSAQ